MVQPLSPASYSTSSSQYGSFYATHISGCQRLPNGNTLVTLGPHGIIFEVTPGGDEVWRYVSPARCDEHAVSFVRQV